MDIPEVLLVETQRFHDHRGFFSESYSREVWFSQGIRVDFVQDNLSCSKRGVVRGLHYQLNPAAMGKLVRCVRGAVFDVAVDIRAGSPYFGRYVAAELTEENGHALWVPPGFAHGFLSLTEDALVLYKCDATHAPAHERAISWNCPEIGIAWPFAPEVVSEKDAKAPGLSAAEYNFVYEPLGC